MTCVVESSSTPNDPAEDVVEAPTGLELHARRSGSHTDPPDSWAQRGRAAHFDVSPYWYMATAPIEEIDEGSHDGGFAAARAGDQCSGSSTMLMTSPRLWSRVASCRQPVSRSRVMGPIAPHPAASNGRRLSRLMSTHPKWPIPWPQAGVTAQGHTDNLPRRTSREPSRRRSVFPRTAWTIRPDSIRRGRPFSAGAAGYRPS